MNPENETPEEDLKETSEEEEAQDIPESPPPPRDWIQGSHAVCWGLWEYPLPSKELPFSIFHAIQAWGEAHCCRFLWVAEGNSDRPLVVLYVAPKPNRFSTGLCAASIYNRDLNLPNFKPWLEGYLAGIGLIQPKDTLTLRKPAP